MARGPIETAFASRAQGLNRAKSKCRFRLSACAAEISNLSVTDHSSVQKAVKLRSAGAHAAEDDMRGIIRYTREQWDDAQVCPQLSYDQVSTNGGGDGPDIQPSPPSSSLLASAHGR